eukprot:2352184-Amphidinium_carterae.1
MQTKYRTIDDHSECWNNRAARRMQKIPMASTATLLVMSKPLHKNLREQNRSCSMLVGTDDMQSAYRQIPLSDASLSMAITMVTHPSSRTVTYHELFGQPFGAAHAVTNFYRVAEWLCRVCRRFFNIALEHFYDDFWYLDLDSSADSARTCLHALFEILGFVLDPAKSQPPTPTPTVLGV